MSHIIIEIILAMLRNKYYYVCGTLFNEIPIRFCVVLRHTRSKTRCPIIKIVFFHLHFSKLSLHDFNASSNELRCM